MDTKKAVLGVLAGLAAGAAIGILFAPDKGSNTRKKISQKGQDLADELNRKVDDKFDKLADVILGKARSGKQETVSTQKETEVA